MKKEVQSKVCKHCGYCEECGRAKAPYHPYPAYPYGWPYPYPNYPWYYHSPTWTVTCGGINSQQSIQSTSHNYSNLVSST